jgi:carbonic anhydrase
MHPLVPDPTAPPYPPFWSGVPYASAPYGGAGPAAVTTGGGPDGVLAELIAGNARFVAGTPRSGHYVTAAMGAAGSVPSAVIVGCMDARVPVEAVFDQGFGTVCAVRSAGHVLDRASLASLEFAVQTLRVGLIVVLGHSRCAAIAAAVTAARTGTLPHGHIRYAVEEIVPAIPDVGIGRDDIVEVVTRRHTQRSVARLRALFGEATVRVVGGHYDVGTGRIALDLS